MGICAALTPEAIIAAAESTGSRALLAMVHGHLTNGHPALAEACLSIPPVKLAIIEATFLRALERASEAGAVAAVAARLNDPT